MTFLPIYARAQWSPPTRIHLGAGLYPALLVNGDTLLAAYTAGQGGRAKIFCLRSLDSGESWSEGVILNDTINYFGAMFPRFVKNGSKIMALWYEYSSVGQLGNIAYSISTNGGNTWDSPQHTLNPGLLDIYLFSAASVDSTVNIIYSKTVWPRMGFFLIRSTNFGGTWSTPRELFRCEDNSYKDMEAYGDTFHLVWSGNFEQGVNWEIYYIKSVDRGMNWTEPETLTAPGDRGARHPSLFINGVGRVALCWTDFRYAPPGWIADIFFAKSTDQGNNWIGETQLTYVHQDAHPDIFYQGDTVHVVFERGNVTVRSIHYIRSTDDGQTWGSVVELDLDPEDSYWPRVAAANGNTYVVWADDRDNPDTTGYGGLYFSKSPYEPSDVTEEAPGLANRFTLSSYPNPFNGSVLISYSFQDEKGGEIEIYNITGKKIRTLNTTAEKGKITWDARDALGNKVSSGIYFARAKTPRNSTTIKLIYLK